MRTLYWVCGWTLLLTGCVSSSQTIIIVDEYRDKPIDGESLAVVFTGPPTIMAPKAVIKALGDGQVEQQTVG